MAKSRSIVAGETESVASVSSSKLLRRRNRAAVLRRIIYLKRRCIRCYFVNVIFSFLILMRQLNTMYGNWTLFEKSTSFLVSGVSFVSSLMLVLFGSVISIYSLSKKLKKFCFLGGNVLVSLGVALNALVLVNIFLPLMPTDTKKVYGYPKDIFEDCKAYPDHVFKFYEQPERRKGRPVVEILEAVQSDGGDDDNGKDEEGNTITTEKSEEVTIQYICEEMLYNVKWFGRTVYVILGMLIVSSITLTLCVMGIVHLWYIHLGGLNHSILPPSLVEPYEFYDELMKRNHSVSSIPDLANVKNSHEKWEKKGVDLNPSKA